MGAGKQEEDVTPRCVALCVLPLQAQESAACSADQYRWTAAWAQWLEHSDGGEEAQHQRKGLLIHFEVQRQEDRRAGSWNSFPIHLKW